MFDFSQVSLDEVVVHKVGNKTREEELVLAEAPLAIGAEMIRELLLKYFLSPFKENTLYNLHHETDLRMNEIYTYAANIFENPEKLFDFSTAIAQHLFNKSEHPKIKSGELYITYLKDCVLEDEMADAIGIFKSENKDTYIKVEQDDKGFSVEYESGTNINKLDKGCLIFNIDKDRGFVVAVIDASNKSEALYWKDDFLGTQARQDYFFHTQNYLNVVKSFIEEKHVHEDKPEAVGLQQKTVAFFKEEKVFDEQKFEEEVLQEPEKIKAFQEYKKEYQEQTATQIPEDFKISTPALKNVKKSFKNTLKLDGNFVIQVLKKEGMIHRGFDHDKGMKYYQLFFDDEE